MALRTGALVLLSLAALALGQDEAMPPRPADPYADPANDPYNLLRYISSDAVVGVAHGLTLLVALLQLNLAYKYRTWWLLILPISLLFFTEGLAIRFVLSREPESRNAFIAQSTLIVLSPCAFIAADYILLGRLARYLGAERHMLILPSRITKIFVFSDVTTFLIQGGGSGLSISNSPSMRDIGSRMFFGGLLLQLISFVCFTAMFALWAYRVHRHEPHIWRQNENGRWTDDWRALAGALAVSCVGIIIRCIYRVAEGSQGYFGHLATTQWIFYTFDTLPLFVAVAVYVPFWPGRFIPRVVASPAAVEGPKRNDHELNILRRYSHPGPSDYRPVAA